MGQPVNKIRRFFRHLFGTAARGRRAFPETALQTIQEAIARGEELHRAEVRMIVEAGMPLSQVLDGVTARQRARELFADYAVWDTEENCGVLIYVNLADHKVEIIADRGVGRLIGADSWQAICRTMTAGFAREVYCESVVQALDQLNTLLQRHYPDLGDRANQLPDRPIIL